MDDLLPRDFVYRSQAKAAPMAASKSTTTTTPLNFGIGSDSEIGRSSSSSRVRSSSGWNSASFLDDQDSIFGSKPSTGYDDVFGGPPKYSSSKPSASPSSFDYDSFFQKDTKAPTPSSPVYDKPVYDDEMDIFDGVQGVKSSSKFDDVFTINSPPKRNEKSSRYEDVFSGVSSPPKQKDDYDDLLGNFGRKVSESSSSRKKSGDMDKEKKMSSFDDLLPGFGGSSPNNRSTPEASGPQQPTVPRTKSPSSIIEDPFVVLESAPGPAYASSGLFTESLEPTDRPRKSGSTNSDVPSARRGLNDDMDPLGDLGKSVPKFSSDTNNRAKDRNSSRTGINMTSTHHSVGEEQTGRTFVETDEIVSRRKAPTEDYRDSHQTLFDMPTVSSDSNKAFDRNGSRSYVTSPGTNSQFSPKFEDNSGASDDVWLTVSEIPLFTQPTSAPQPSRPPPPRPTQGSKTVKGPFSASNSKKVNEFSSYESISQTSRRPEPVSESAKSSGMSSMDELEEFAKAKRRSNADELGDSLSSEEEIETNSTAATSAAAMKKAVDLAEAKFKHAREVRERENAKGAKTRGQQEREEKVMPDVQERELREKQERLDREREQREREEKESEQRKLEKERERARELEKEKNRQAVERATKEARERAATEARLKAERAQAEKAKAEALERSQRQAVQRAHAEARKRLAAEAREKAERAAAEARERAAAEARERANAEAREKANAEAREKANAEARRRADKPTATAEPRAGRGSQKNENDLESFFGGMANRPSSAPKGRTTSTDSTPQFHTRTGPEGSQIPSSAGTSSGINRTFSTPNIVDDLTSIFGGMPSSGDFQDIEGETEERRRARLERHQRTQDRAKLALAAKNDRDLKAQREQEERHRISETLDVEIKRWAAGKEGNLRALLSTLQYVLWKECGWQAVSLTDLITGASVKKVYRKATLCIHPDKVQQKGANLQQKYIAEKVFDLLKEISAVRSNDGSTNVLRGKRGRLEKEHTGIQKKRGRPPKSLKTVLSTEGKGQKRRGRPPKSLRIDPATEVEALERSGKGRSSAGISSADLSTEGPEHFEASGMEIVGTTALTEPGVLIPSAEEDLHPSALLVGDNRGHEHERNSSQEMVVTVVVRDSVDLSNHCADEHQNPSVLLESTSPRRDTRGPEHSGTSGKGILDTVLVNEGGVLSPTAEDDLQVLVLPGVSQSPNRYEEAVAPQCWPFVKSSPMWETVESLNAFYLIPQHPHFQPLEQHSEAVREGLALGSMVSFANLVDTTNSAKFDDVEGSLEPNLVELSHFEELGFTVDAIRSRIQEVLSVKASCIKLEDGSKASESRLMEQNHRIDELQAQLDEIQGKLQAARTEKMELEKEITEFRESREAARLEFERVVSAPW